MAAFLGFILPSWGAFYNGRITTGLILLGLEILLDGVSLATAGIPAVIYHVVGGIMSHRWASRRNERVLKTLQSA